MPRYTNATHPIGTPARIASRGRDQAYNAAGKKQDHTVIPFFLKFLDRITENTSKRVNIQYAAISIASVLILSLWAGLHYYSEFERKSAFSNAEKLLSSFARTFEEHTVRTVRMLDQTTIFVKQEYESKGDRLRLGAYGQEGIFVDKFYNLIVIVDADGWVRLSDRPLQPSNVRDREHFQIHANGDTGQLFISRPVVGRSSKKMSVQFTRRINRANGEFNGIVVTSLDPTYFNEFYQSVDFGNNGVATLVGTDGIIRARRNSASEDIGEDIGGSRLFRELSQADHGTFHATSAVDNARHIYAYRKLKEYPLVVVAGLAENEALQTIKEQLTILNVLGSIITLLIVISTLAVLLLLRYQEKVQESLRQNEQDALSSSRVKSEFLARTSHELRTPLNGILGFSEYIRDNTGEPEHRKFADTIFQAGHHLLSLVNTLLDLAKIEAGKMNLALATEPLIPLVQKAVAIHTPVARKKGLALRTEFAKLPATLHCDATKVAQVLHNLLHNAIKFTDAGSVTVRVEYIGDKIYFSVIDTGPGIPKDQLPHLFDQFRQLGSFATRKHEGSGLGLALAKQLVELMHGQIGVHSKPEHGSTFYFHLPA